MKIELEQMAETFALCRLPPHAPMPPGLTCAFWADVPGECSLICPEREVPAGTLAVEGGYRALRVCGSLDLTLVGILARLSAVLAQARVPLCAVSTFRTDYLFVPGALLGRAVAAFEENEIRVYRVADA